MATNVNENYYNVVTGTTKVQLSTSGVQKGGGEN